ncbi:unnamed protein product, partial [Rotaria sp. Silwood1]
MTCVPYNDRRVLRFGGVPDPASIYPEVAALRNTYESDYVHGDRASRNRYAQAYIDIAHAHPNILPLEEQRSTAPKNLPEFSQKKLECGGRACYKCGKCRDWRFDGPSEYWHKIRDWGNWTTDDWLVYKFDDWKRGWHRRFDATCSSNLGYGAHRFTEREGVTDGEAT